MVKKIFFLTQILFLCFACDSTEPPPDIPPIPTTEIEGPGGPAYLHGFIGDLIQPTKSVSNTKIYILNQQDYSDTLLSVFVNSTDASFKITNMPEGVFDLIFMNDNYLCAKIGKLLLKPTGNSFYNPNSSGYFIDSTIYITSIADSFGRPYPPIGLYGPAIYVYLKSETPDSIGWQIVQESGCDTLRVWQYDDPVFDPLENDVYYLHCHSIKNVKNMLIYFNLQKTILLASPDYAIIYP